MKGVDTRVEGMQYFTKVYLEDEGRFETRIVNVQEWENPEDVFKRESSKKKILLERGKIIQFHYKK